MAAHEVRRGHVGMDRERADDQLIGVNFYTAQAGHGAEIDQCMRRLETELHRRDETMAAGEQLPLVAVFGHQLQGFFYRPCCNVAEASGKHDGLPSGLRARREASGASSVSL